MTTWTSDQLTAIGNADELQIAPRRDDGQLSKPVTIWVVRDGGDAAYRAKYGGPYVDAMVAAGVRATTLKLVPH
jgi:hypothetical protein